MPGVLARAGPDDSARVDWSLNLVRNRPGEPFASLGTAPDGLAMHQSREIRQPVLCNQDRRSPMCAAFITEATPR